MVFLGDIVVFPFAGVAAEDVFLVLVAIFFYYFPSHILYGIAYEMLNVVLSNFLNATGWCP